MTPIISYYKAKSLNKLYWCVKMKKVYNITDGSVLMEIYEYEKKQTNN